MAKKQKQSESTTIDLRAELDRANIPEGFSERSDDIVGTWNSDGPGIRCIPRFAKTFDSKLDKSKPSVLLFAELVQPCDVATQDGDVIEARAGEMVGIWVKPGMKAIARHRDVDTWIVVKGEKDVGKASPMKLFTVASKHEGLPLEITEDYRVQSRGAPLLLPLSQALASGERRPPEHRERRVAAGTHASQTAPVDDDDVPF